jgi:hypothetical protein
MTTMSIQTCSSMSSGDKFRSQVTPPVTPPVPLPYTSTYFRKPTKEDEPFYSSCVPSKRSADEFDFDDALDNEDDVAAWLQLSPKYVSVTERQLGAVASEAAVGRGVSADNYNLLVLYEGITRCTLDRVAARCVSGQLRDRHGRLPTTDPFPFVTASGVGTVFKTHGHVSRSASNLLFFR